MPSVEQMVNEIKGILGQIEASTEATATQAGQIHDDTQTIKSTLATLLGSTQEGFANLSQGLATVIDRQEETNNLLELNDAQNRAIICWLSILADLSCKQLHRLDRQIELQESIECSAGITRQIVELANAHETLEVKRERELAERIERCCPPEHPEPEPCYEPCKEKDPPPHKRQIASFEPLTFKKKR